MRPDADGHAAPACVAKRLQFLARAIGGGEDMLGVTDQHRSVRRDSGGAARPAIEQQHAHFVLELGDAGAQRLLRQAKLRRRRGEAAALDHRKEAAQLLYLHDGISLQDFVRNNAAGSRYFQGFISRA